MIRITDTYMAYTDTADQVTPYAEAWLDEFRGTWSFAKDNSPDVITRLTRDQAISALTIVELLAEGYAPDSLVIRSLREELAA